MSARDRVSRCVVAAVVIGCALSACVREERVSLVYAPLSGVTIVPDATSVSLDVVSEDKRLQFRDRVASVRGASKILVTDNDVADLVRGAVARQLQDQGFTLAAGGLVITVDLQNFYCDYTAISVSASVVFTLRVRDGAGRTLYSRHYEGAAGGGSGVFQSGGDAKVALERALGRAVKEVGDDKALQAALLSAKPRASVTPSARRT